MNIKHGISYLLPGALALVLTQCDMGETVNSVVNLPFPLLMNGVSAGPSRIVLMQTDGTIIDLAGGLAPQWSPDGTRIAFWTNTSGGLDEIFIMNSDGSNIRNLTNSASIYENRPVWSPNGSMIASDDVVLGGGSGLGIITSLGTDRHFVLSGHEANSPAWFPDGGSLLFTRRVGSRLQINRVNSDGTGETALTSDTTRSYYLAGISPNGVYCSYSRLDSLRRNPIAMIIRDITSGQEVEFAGGILGTNWSPQSDWLYCTEISGSGNTMYRISPTSKIKQNLSRKPPGGTYSDGVFSLSSDGKWLTFWSDRSGSRLIYMMGADGSNQLRITLDPQFGYALWKP